MIIEKKQNIFGKRDVKMTFTTEELVEVEINPRLQLLRSFIYKVMGYKEI